MAESSSFECLDVVQLQMSLGTCCLTLTSRHWEMHLIYVALQQHWNLYITYLLLCWKIRSTSLWVEWNAAWSHKNGSNHSYIITACNRGRNLIGNQLTIYIYIYIYIYWPTIVKSNLNAPFSKATTPRCRGVCNSFPWIVSLTLDLYIIILLSKETSSTIFESLAWLNLGLNPSLPGPLADTIMPIWYMHNIYQIGQYYLYMHLLYSYFPCFLYSLRNSIKNIII